MKLRIHSTIFLLFSYLLVNAQSNYQIDLAETVNITQKRTVSSNKLFEIYLTNKLPYQEYDIEITKKAIPIDAFSLPSRAEEIETAGGGVAMCARFINEVYEIYRLDREEDLKLKLTEIEEDIQSITEALYERDTTEEGCMISHLHQARNILDLTRIKIGEWNLKRGEQLEIVITRATDDEPRTWTQVFSTEPRGEWQVSYGFSFITQIFNEEKQFFSAANDTSFTIKQENNRKSLSFAPSLFFTWMPTKSINEPWSIGFSGGLGFDFENPTVFLSPTISYNQNIKIHLGLVAHKQNVLLGKYEENQVINENLGSEQLHEQLYKINPFISVSFRFDQNPFQQQSE